MQVRFKVSSHAIVITPVESPAYEPSKTELAAIRRGEAEITRGEYATLNVILHDLDRPRRKSGGRNILAADF